MDSFELTIRVSDSGSPEAIELLRRLVDLAESGAAVVTAAQTPTYVTEGYVSRESLVQYLMDEEGYLESSATSIAGRIWACLIKDPFADLSLDAQCIEHPAGSCACSVKENWRWQLSIARLKEAQSQISGIEVTGFGRALKSHLNGWISQL